MNLMGGRQGDEKYRLGGGLSSSSSSSSSSSPTAHHEQLQLGGSSFPLSYYSSSPSSSNYACSLRDMEMMRGGGLLGRVEEEQQRGPGTMMVEKEHMFDKVVTPSDVGKLNRLVIPKQHAEKYFPLDSSTNDKGLLLNFEDRNGKPWRFRYSYWNSSQSYVMTKGWSRFVKEKKLDAGDIVSFQRGMGDSAKDRLFIDWSRRPAAPSPPPYWATQYPPPHPYYLPPPHLIQHMSSRLGNPRPGPPLYEHHHHHHVLVNRSGRAAGVGVGMGMGVVFESVPVVQGKAAAKRMRLFGVNISTDTEEEPILSSTALPVPPSSSTAATDRLGLFLNNSHNPACSSSSMSLDLDI